MFYKDAFLKTLQELEKCPQDQSRFAGALWRKVDTDHLFTYSPGPPQ